MLGKIEERGLQNEYSSNDETGSIYAEKIAGSAN